MTPVERHAELVYAESLFEKVFYLSIMLRMLSERSMERRCWVLSTLETGWPL
jgi:hypothetical protein